MEGNSKVITIDCEREREIERMLDDIFNSFGRMKMERSGSYEGRPSPYADCRRGFKNLRISMKIKSIKNFPLEDSFSSLCLSSTSSTLPSKGNFVVYLRLFDPFLSKCVWSQITYKNGQNCSDQSYTGPVTRILEEENTSWREDLICVMDNRFFKFDGISGLTLEPTIGGWEKVPSRKKLSYVFLAASLNKSLYVVQDLRGPPFNYRIPFDGWIEVLRPQSNDWEPLSCPPPWFSSRSIVFFHAVEELDKLLFGSFEDNVLYLYDPQAMAPPEKVENFCSTFSAHTDTIVVGKYLIWHHRAKIYVYNLATKWLRQEDIVGMDVYVRLTSPHCVSSKFLYFGDGRFCLIFLDFDEYGGTSVLRFFEFSLFGPLLVSPLATSSYTHEFGQCEVIQSAFVMAEGESESAMLMSDATATAGNGLIELRRIEASKEVAATLAEYPTAA